MAICDAILIGAETLQPAATVLNGAAPPAQLPQLQRAEFGHAVIGYGDFFIAGVFGALLAAEGRRQRPDRAADVRPVAVVRRALPRARHAARDGSGRGRAAAVGGVPPSQPRSPARTPARVDAPVRVVGALFHDLFRNSGAATVSQQARIEPRGSLCTQTRRGRRAAWPLTLAASPVRRAPDRARSSRQPRRLRGARRALPVAPARVLPPHARLAARTPRTCCRRSSPPPSTRSSPTTGRSTRARGSTASRATAASTTCVAQQPIGVDSMDVHLAEHGATTADKVRQARGVPRADRRRPGPARDAAHRAAAARDRRALLRADRRGDGDDDPVASSRCSCAPASRSPRPPRRASCRATRCGSSWARSPRACKRRTTPPVRRHICACASAALASAPSCKSTNKALAAVMPVGFAARVQKDRPRAPRPVGRRGRRRERGAAPPAPRPARPSPAAATGGLISAGMATLATKAAAGLAAAALVTAGAVEIEHRAPREAAAPPAPLVAQAPADVRAPPTPTSRDAPAHVQRALDAPVRRASPKVAALKAGRAPETPPPSRPPPELRSPRRPRRPERSGARRRPRHRRHHDRLDDHAGGRPARRRSSRARPRCRRSCRPTSRRRRSPARPRRRDGTRRPADDAGRDDPRRLRRRRRCRPSPRRSRPRR